MADNLKNVLLDVIGIDDRGKKNKSLRAWAADIRFRGSLFNMRLTKSLASKDKDGHVVHLIFALNVCISLLVNPIYSCLP